MDASEAGLGDLDIDVICKDTRIPTQSQAIGRAHNRYTFIPMSPHNHLVNIKYNFDDVPGGYAFRLLLHMIRLIKDDYFAPCTGAKYCDERVCVSVCPLA